MPEAAAPSAKVALITGAARRIGAAIARRLHADGYDLALHYRASKAEMDALLAELNAVRSGSAIGLQANLSEFDRLPELIAKTVGHFGRLDALVNNASSFYPTPLGTATPAQWDELFASNARAPFFLAQAAAPHLRAARGGIVNLGDIHGETPLANYPIVSTTSMPWSLFGWLLLAGTRRRCCCAIGDAGAHAIIPAGLTGGDRRCGGMAAGRCQLRDR